MLKFWIIALFSGMLSAFPAVAQSSYFHFPTYQITTREGLAQMQIRDLHQDMNGFIWIATQGGLSRYDGQEVVSYYETDGLPGGQIVNLTSDRDKIWGMTQTELFSFDGVTVERFMPPVDPENRLKKLIFVDRNGFLWIEFNEGVLLLKEGEFRKIHEIYPEIEDNDFQLILGKTAWERVVLLDQDNQVFFFHLTNGSIVKDTVHPGKNMTIVTESEGKVNSPDYGWIRYYYPGTVTIHKIFKVFDGRLQEVFSYSKPDQRFQFISEQAPKGIRQESGEKSEIFIKLQHDYKEVELPFNHIRFCMPQQERVFVATDDGLITVFANGLETYENSFCQYSWSVIPIDDGKLLVGCWRDGVGLISKDGQLLELYKFPDSDDPLKYAQILTNYVKADAVLFGTIDGFYWLDPDKPGLHIFKLYTTVEALEYDPHHQQYLAAGNHLFYRIDRSLTEIVDSVSIPREILSHVNANAILSMNDHSVWVGGNGGLARYDEGEENWTVYTLKKGISPVVGWLHWKVPMAMICGLDRVVGFFDMMPGRMSL